MKNLQNLKRLTKEQLITQLQTQKEAINQNKSEVVNKTKQNTSLYQKFIEIYSLLKSIILSITLITLIIKIIKKYKFIRSILKFLNVLIVGIFGVNMFELWGFGDYRSWWLWIKIIDSYIWLKNLIWGNGYTTIPDNSDRGWEVKGVDRGTTKIEPRWDAKPFDWNTPLPIEEVQNDNTHIYITVALILIGLGLAFYYRNEIYNFGKPSNPPTPPTDNVVGGIPNPDDFIESPVERNIFERIKNVFFVKNSNVNLKQSVKDKFYNAESDNGSVETLKPCYTGKNVKFESPVETPVASSSNVTLDNSNVNTFLNESNIESVTDRMMTAQLTGENYLDFQDKSNDLFARICTFLTYQKVGNFPSIIIQQGLYHSIRKSLYDLSFNTKWYNLWLTDPTVESKIDEFIRIESDVNGDPDVALENQSTPQQIMTDVDKVEEIQAKPETIVENIIEPTVLEKPTVVERPKAKFNQLMEAIRAKRESFVSPEPEIKSEITPDEYQIEETEPFQLGETKEQIIQDDNEMLFTSYATDELQTENYKAALSPLPIENVAQPMEANITTPVEAMKTVIETTKQESRASFTNLFKDIKSKRIEYGTPIVENKTIETSSSNIDSKNTMFEDTAALFDEEDNVNVTTPVPPNSPQLSGEIDDFDDVQVDVNESIVNIDLGRMWSDLKQLNIITSNNKVSEFSLNIKPRYGLLGGLLPYTGQNIDLSEQFPNWEEENLKVVGISIIGKDDKIVTIWKKPKLN